MLNSQIKTKHYYWLILPAFCLGLQIAGFIYSAVPSQKKSTLDAGRQAAPTVLGEFTSVRGEPADTGLQNPEKIKDLDLNAISAESFLAYDINSSFVLAQKNPAQKISIASLTKLLTAFVVYQKTNLGESIKITGNDMLNIAPALGLKLNDEIRVSDLFNAMLIGSTNDAALALANFAASSTGQSFADLMNEQAGNLQMANSKFSNPMGFDSQNNFSTAEDLQKLVDASQKLAAFSNLGKKSSYNFTSNLGFNYYTKATNKLTAQYPDLEAVKTGFTESSKGAMITKLSVGDHKIIIIILDSQNREKDTLILRQQILGSYKF